MYTDEDLNRAVEAGIFKKGSVQQFRELVSMHQGEHRVDEENFRLLSGFNDIFVTIACLLLLISSVFVVAAMGAGDSSAFVAIPISWLLAEFFVKKRRMALPAIVLLLSFVQSVFTFVLSIPQEPSLEASSVAAVFATLAAWVHWRRFRVPVTLAVGVGAAIGFVCTLLVVIFPELKRHIYSLLFVGGLVSFALAMRWDMSDPERLTRRSDVAFWLHLLAAPLMIHPVFIVLGIMDGVQDVGTMGLVLVLYALLSVVSLLIDRRALMVSSLIYVVYALGTLFERYGRGIEGVALAGTFIGISLVLLAGFWHRVRVSLLAKMPTWLKARLPAAD